MKGAQIGGTECGNNWLGYIIHHTPGPTLSVNPTVDTAKRNSKQRIDPLIEESPVLRELVKPARSKDSGNTVLTKEFPGGILVLAGANSAAGLRSMPVRFFVLDEVDAYPGDVEGEGDPIALAEARTRTFARRKIYMSRRRRLKACRVSSENMKSAINAALCCRVRSAEPSNGSSFRNSNGRTINRRKRPMNANIAHGFLKSITKPNCLRTLLASPCRKRRTHGRLSYFQFVFTAGLA